MSKLLECALPIASDLLLPHITKVVNAIKDAPKDVADMKDKLDRIQDIIHEVDRIAAAEEDNTVRDGIKAKMKQMIETSFHMEDILDEYTIREQQQNGDDPGCAALPSKTVDFAKALTSRLQFSYMNADVKSEFQGVQEGNKSEEDGSQNQSSLAQWSSSSGGNQNATLRYLQDAPLYIKEADVVGFDVPKMKLIDWSVDKREDLTVMCVVGIGGQGKTTLVKKVFDSKEVVEKFNCHIWITVSQSYTVEGLLRDMLQKLYKAEEERQKLHNHKEEEERQKLLKAKVAAMDRRSLIDEEVREHLCNKRYVVVFDDVWNQRFWDEMQYALMDNENGSRIFITTRKKDVAMYCKKSVSVQEHELQPLALDMSLALFNKKAFGSVDGCPDNLKDVSIEIVEKCEGLPLAIVAIGGLLSRKDQDSIEWQMFSQNLSYHLGKDPDLTVVKKILALSYHDLPYRLRSCFLYFGIYPEDFEVKSKRLIRQWIAEGFVKDEERKTLEEVGKEYLKELIQRNLVQVSSFTIDDKVKSCRVHDVLREVILTKLEDLKFCQCIGADDQPIVRGIIRRLSIAIRSNNLMERIESSHVRSLLFFNEVEVFTVYEELHPDFVKEILSKYMMLKLLDFENGFLRLRSMPEDLGNLIHLKYLSLRGTHVPSLPKSIVDLQNLETLDLRGSVRTMPKEILKLRKLQHLLVDAYEWPGYEDGIGGMTSLQTLREVRFPEEELFIEMEKLTQLRELRLRDVKEEHGSALQSSINKMKHLEKLCLKSWRDDILEILYLETAALSELGPGGSGSAVFDLHSISFRPNKLRKLGLDGTLNKLLAWIPKLQYLVKLTLIDSKLDEDPSKLLQHMKNLLVLRIGYQAYDGESLHFQAGGFQKLKELNLGGFHYLNSIIIDKGALHSLKKLQLGGLDQLKMVPSGIQHLKKLEVLDIRYMPPEFVKSISRGGGQDYWIVEHVAQVIIERF